jgi:DNA-binding transcriptional MerR regulator|tara:strand:- start:1587 stop:2000 length:414 start_codon:yes stop_codon:yes gene_type:complete
VAKKLSSYNRFVKTHRKKGFSMKQIGAMWRKKKRGGKISTMFKTKKRKTTIRKRVVRRRKMAKRKIRRRRSNPMGSYSKSNIALGTLLGSVAPKFVPGASAFLPLAGLIPKSPTAVKVMSWILASKTISDRFIGSDR